MMRELREFGTVALAGAVAGALDILYAITFYWVRNDVPPTRILQSVASGLLGSEAYEGGARTAALGLALHFFIATNVAAVYVFAASRLDVLTKRAVASGILYGIGVYLVMNFVVLPLSRFPNALKFSTAPVIGGLLAHMFLIGLPIALITRRARAVLP